MCIQNDTEAQSIQILQKAVLIRKKRVLYNKQCVFFASDHSSIPAGRPPYDQAPRSLTPRSLRARRSSSACNLKRHGFKNNCCFALLFYFTIFQSKPELQRLSGTLVMNFLRTYYFYWQNSSYVFRILAPPSRMIRITSYTEGTTSGIEWYETVTFFTKENCNYSTYKIFVSELKGNTCKSLPAYQSRMRQKTEWGKRPVTSGAKIVTALQSDNLNRGRLALEEELVVRYFWL